MRHGSIGCVVNAAESLEETVAEVMLRTEALAKGFILHLRGGAYLGAGERRAGAACR